MEWIEGVRLRSASSSDFNNERGSSEGVKGSAQDLQLVEVGCTSQHLVARPKQKEPSVSPFGLCCKFQLVHRVKCFQRPHTPLQRYATVLDAWFLCG